MAAPIPIGIWHWAAFVVVIMLLVWLDLGLLHRTPRVMKMGEALRWTVVWLLLALVFAAGLAQWRGRDESLQFFTSYLVELSLSLDNLFAIAAIFAAFGLPAEQQHRVLSWGILGALLMRGLMIGAGAILLQSFHWLLYLLGLFLVVTGLRWAFAKPTAARPEDNWVVRLARKFLPISTSYDGDRFVTVSNGKRSLTPLMLVLLAVETSDLIFAVDSIPAVFTVTQNAFIVFTSNIFAVLGLRSLYFVLAGAMKTFRYLRSCMAGVLIIVGLKMVAARWYPIPTSASLVVILVTVVGALACSVVAGRFEKKSAAQISPK
jgi:tellurite resistance protein TerC